MRLKRWQYFVGAIVLGLIGGQGMTLMNKGHPSIGAALVALWIVGFIGMSILRIRTIRAEVADDLKAWNDLLDRMKGD